MFLPYTYIFILIMFLCNLHALIDGLSQNRCTLMMVSWLSTFCFGILPVMAQIKRSLWLSHTQWKWAICLQLTWPLLTTIVLKQVLLDSYRQKTHYQSRNYTTRNTMTENTYWTVSVYKEELFVSLGNLAASGCQH